MSKKLSLRAVQELLGTPLDVQLARLHAEADRCRAQVIKAQVDPDSEFGQRLVQKLRATGENLCLAMTREGHPCRRVGLGKGGRCKLHGGGSTGPRTAEGLLRSAANLANWHRRRLHMPLLPVPGDEEKRKSR